MVGGDTDHGAETPTMAWRHRPWRETQPWRETPTLAKNKPDVETTGLSVLCT